MSGTLSLDDIFARSMPITECGCWIWMGGLQTNGYGFVKGRTTHRCAWIARNGPIPEGMCVLHRCDVPACVNPDHLFLGTHLENMRDKIVKGRHGNSSLTASDIPIIRQSAEHTRVLAKRFDVTEHTIRNVRSGRTWSHIT